MTDKIDDTVVFTSVVRAPRRFFVGAEAERRARLCGETEHGTKADRRSKRGSPAKRPSECESRCKWSTAPLKAAWFDDDERAENELKATTTPARAAEQMTVQDFFDLFASDEPASG
jgi:hypothetical protein